MAIAAPSGDNSLELFATPAIADGRMYVRTRGALYCFGKPPAAPPRGAQARPYEVIPPAI